MIELRVDVETIHELRVGDRLIAWMHPRPPYCDRGRYDATIEAGHWRSEADPWPRYYFDLDRGKAEIEAYLDAKKIDRAGAEWVEVQYHAGERVA